MTKQSAKSVLLEERYQSIFDDVTGIVEAARLRAAHSVNAVMTAAYWLIGRYIVEFEQEGKQRAGYGQEIIGRLAADLTARCGRGFSVRNVWQMKAFYLAWPKLQTSSADSETQPILQTVSAESSLSRIATCFPLPWSAYARLLLVKNSRARAFYETEALRGGWSVRQLNRQIDAQFYERSSSSTKGKSSRWQLIQKPRTFFKRDMETSFFFTERVPLKTRNSEVPVPFFVPAPELLHVQEAQNEA